MPAESDRFAVTQVDSRLFAVFDRISRFTAICEAESQEEIDLSELAEGNEDSATGCDAFDSRLEFGTWVLNVTEECNLRCRYCSRHHADYGGSPMAPETMLRTLQAASSIGRGAEERVTVQFHGGEPLIHFDRIVASVERLSERERAALDLRIQTNGSLLSREVVKICRDNDIHIGMSIDGPPSINGVHRRYRGGRPLGDELLGKLTLLREGLSRHRVSCLCVMSTANVDKADVVFDFIMSEGIDDLSLLPLYPDYTACLTGCEELVPRTADMVSFSSRIFDRWLERLRRGHAVCIPSFQIWVWNMLHANANSVLTNSCCGVGESLVFVDTDGSVYPCGPFSYAPEWRMGFVGAGAASRLLSSTVSSQFRTRTTDAIQGCRECGLQAICRGGCPANSYLHNRSILATDPFCEYWKGTIGHVLRRIADDPSVCDLIPSYSIRL